jgi:hypothetical protein
MQHAAQVAKTEANQFMTGELSDSLVPKNSGYPHKEEGKTSVF